MVGAVNKASFSQLVVARIFMKQTWEDRRRHVRTDAVVRKGRTVTFPVGVPSLPPRFWIILCLCYGREGTVEWIGAPIEYARSRQSEFLTGSERREFTSVFHCPVVREHFENTIVNSSCFSFQFALPNCLSGFVFIFLSVFRLCCLRIRWDRDRLLGLLLLCQRR